MLVVVSPAKKLDWTERDVTMTEPRFSEAAQELAGVARALSVDDLKKLMKISDDLAKLNRDRFRDFDADPAQDDLRPAALGQSAGLHMLPGWH